jgi:excisionase family DNA binding protein
MDDNGKVWMTIEEVADHLRCSTRHISELVANKEIPFNRFAGKVLFHLEVIDKWMLSSLQEAVVTNTIKSDSTNIDTTIKSDCDRESVEASIQKLIEFKDSFVYGLGKNLKKDLEKSDYHELSGKVYAQLSRWCDPHRDTKRERDVKVIAHDISRALYGKVIPRTNHPSYPD